MRRLQLAPARRPGRGSSLATTPLLGAVPRARLRRRRAPGDRVFLPVERAVYRLGGVDPEREQPWSVYALSLLAFSAVSVVGLYVLQRIQGVLPLNPTDVGARAAGARVQHRRQLRHEHELAELRRRVDDEPPDADGRARRCRTSSRPPSGSPSRSRSSAGSSRRRSETIGNFWVDLTRDDDPRAAAARRSCVALVLVSQGVVQNLRGCAEATTVEGATQAIYRGPIASQEAIKELGTNGGGIVNANSAHPFENPTAFTNLLEMLGAPRDPVRAHVRVRAARRRPAPGLGGLRGDVRRSGSARSGSRWASRSTATRASRRSAAAAGTWRARRCASAPPPPASSRRRRPAPRPAR